MNETTIAVAIWDGVEELDVVGPYEVLTAWGTHANGRSIRVHTVAERADEVRCAHGLRLLPDRTWDDVGEIDVLVLPGGNARPQAEDERVLDRVRGLGENGTLMTSVCTGALILAAAGLLEGRPATTHWSALDSLGAYDGVEVRPDARFVDDGHGGHRGRRLRRDRHGPPPGRAAGLAGAGEGRAALHPVRPRASRMRRAAAIAALLALAALVRLCQQRRPPRRALDQGLRRGGPVLADHDACAPGHDGLGRVQDAVPRRPRQHQARERRRSRSGCAGRRSRSCPGWARSGRSTPAERSTGIQRRQDREAHRAERRGRVQHLDRRRLRLGCGRPGSERRPRLPARRTASSRGSRPATGRPSMAFDGANGLGREPPRHDDRPHRPRPRTSPRLLDDPRRRERPRARADDVLPRQPVGHGPRHRPAEGESGDRRRSSRRSRSARAGSTSSPPATSSGCRRAAPRSTRAASRRWTR